MNKLTFIGNVKEEQSKTSIIKKISSISCRMHLDIIDGFLTVENVNDEQIDVVIDLIDNYYNTDKVIIDNLSNHASTETTAIAPITEETTQVEPVSEKKSKPAVLEPQSEDDLIIPKVEFKNEYIEGLTNKFLRTAFWAIYKQGISEKEIGKYIFTLMNEISMIYNSDNVPPELVVGDIVEVNYGMHLKGEIRGNHILAIVCDITAYNMVYLVPITKVTTNLTSTNSPLPLSSSDATYYFDEYSTFTGTALVDKSKYLRIERVNKVVGKTRPAFLVKLLNQLPKTFDFTKCFATNNSENSNPNNNAVSNSTGTTVSANESTKPSIEKMGKEESALLELFSDAFNKLDRNKSAEEQIDVFFTDIEMPSDLEFIKEAFIISCKIDTINFDNIISELTKSHPEIKETIFKTSLKTDFKNWLKKYPKLTDISPRFSFTSLIKTFVKCIK